MLGKAVSVGKQAIGLGRQVAEFALKRAAALLPGAGESSPPPPARPKPPPRAAVPTPAPPAPVTPRPQPRTPAEPVHIDTEDELVGEFAEQGAENGAGAEIQIAEPWPGYGALSANDVIDRLAAASEAERAVVGLYEREHKKRKTVLAAVERREGF